MQRVWYSDDREYVTRVESRGGATVIARALFAGSRCSRSSAYSQGMHEVQRLDERWNRAYQTRDHAALEDVFAADWISVFADGRSVERAAFLEQLPHNPPATLEFSEFAMRVFGDTAVTWGRVRISGATLTVDQRFMRMWVQRLGVWQAVAAQVIPIFQTKYYNRYGSQFVPLSVTTTLFPDPRASD